MDVRAADNLNFDAIPGAIREAVKRFGEVVRGIEEIEIPEDAMPDEVKRIAERHNTLLRKIKSTPLPEVPDGPGDVKGVMAAMLKELDRQGNITGSGVRITNDEGGICLTPEG